MKQTILTIIISVVTTLVAFNFLSQENGDKLIDVAEDVLMVQVAWDVVDVATWSVSTGDVATGAVMAQVDTGSVVVDSGAVATGDVATGIDYNPTGYPDGTGAVLLDQ